MRTKFAAMILMIVMMASMALPVQAASGAGSAAGAQQYAGTNQYTDMQQHAGTRQYIGAQRNGVARRESASREADIFRRLGNGWHYEKGNWYYVRGGRAVKGWIKDSGKWYFLGGDGRMQTGWIRVSGKWYYLAANGAMRTGWIRVSGKWYYLAADGAMRTGWIKVGGKWYYLAANGAMQTGWVKDNGKWYYLASGGAMKTGWLGIGDRKFYLTNNGVRVTGWRTINGKRYCFRSNGVLDVSKTRKANAGKEKSADQNENTVGKKTGKNSGSPDKTAKTKGELVAAYALRFVGNPYVYGGCSLTQGTDCSGFVMLIYRHFGVSLPHYDAAIRTKGKSVSSLKEAKAGDIICYYGHVAIYLGDGRIVHASNSRDGIKISERADYRAIASIRRIFE